MDKTGKYLVVGIAVTAAIAGIGIGLDINFAEADLTDAEITQKINDYLKNPDNREWILQTLGVVSDEDLSKAFVMLDKDHHVIFDEVSKNFTSISKTITTMNNKLSIIQFGLGNNPAPSLPDADYQMRCAQIDGQIVPDCVFNQSQAIYLLGTYTGSDTNYQYSIRAVGGAVLNSGNLSVPSTGGLLISFNTLADEQKGLYEASFTIGGKTDTVSFEIK